MLRPLYWFTDRIAQLAGRRLTIKSILDSIRRIRWYMGAILRHLLRICLRVVLRGSNKTEHFLGRVNGAFDLRAGKRYAGGQGTGALKYWVFYDCRTNPQSFDLLQFLTSFLAQHNISKESDVTLVILMPKEDPINKQSQVEPDNLYNLILNVMLEPLYLVNHLWNVMVISSLDIFNELYGSAAGREGNIIYPESGAEGHFAKTPQGALPRLHISRKLYDIYLNNKRLPELAGNETYRSYVQEYLRHHCGGCLPISITLRTKKGRATFPDLDAYLDFVELVRRHEISRKYPLQFAVVPDFYSLDDRAQFARCDALGIPVCYEAALSFRVRHELYRACLLNLFTASGATWASYLDPRVNYIVLNTQHHLTFWGDHDGGPQDYESAKGAFYQSSFWRYGEQFPWATKYQHLSWRECANGDDILHEFTEMMSTMSEDGLIERYDKQGQKHMDIGTDKKGVLETTDS